MRDKHRQKATPVGTFPGIRRVVRPVIYTCEVCSVKTTKIKNHDYYSISRRKAVQLKLHASFFNFSNEAELITNIKTMRQNLEETL